MGRKALVEEIKRIFTEPSAEAALTELYALTQRPWGEKFPTVLSAWHQAWDRMIYAPKEVHLRRSTNAIESINAMLRKIIKTRGYLSSDDAATKLNWLALRNITAYWGRAATDRKEAMN